MISKIRGLLYRSASVLGDVQAVSSGKPDRMVKRLIRKVAYRNFGSAMRRWIR